MEKTAPPPPNVILSDDILLQILCRLPLHHLLRFKKVSPSFTKLTSEAFWLRQSIPSSSSTSSSSLIVQDRCRESNVVHLDLRRRNDDSAAAAVVIADTVLLPPSQYPTNLALLATCNGLLLYRDPVEKVYCVSNPVTRQWFRLPLNIPKGLNLAACIDFDPQKTPHFKVAQFIHVPRLSLYLVVFDSRSKTICDAVEMNQLVEIELVRRRHCCVLLDGAVYVFGSLTKILRVDVRARSCLNLKLPVRWTEQCRDTARMTLHKCEGRVHFAYHQQNEFEQIRMWMLEEDEDGVGHETTRWIPMFKCSYRFLNEQIRGQLPGHYLDSVLDIALGPDVVFFSAETGRGRGRGTGRYSTVLVPYCFRTKTVLRMSPLKVFAKRIFAF